MFANDDNSLRSILERTRTIALVGYSANPDRASNEVAHFLNQVGYRIIAINPGLAGQMAFGNAVFAELTDVTEPVDMVDVFRKAEDTPAIARQAVAVGAKTLWLQLGVVSEESKKIVSDAGMSFVMDRCPKIEWPRLMKTGR